MAKMKKQTHFIEENQRYLIKHSVKRIVWSASPMLASFRKPGQRSIKTNPLAPPPRDQKIDKTKPLSLDRCWIFSLRRPIDQYLEEQVLASAPGILKVISDEQIL